MKSSSCAMATLVEAAHDGRLDDREAASIARHLRACAACGKLAADLASMRRLAAERPPPPPPIEHRRARLRLLREAAAVEAPRPVARWRAALLAAAVLGLSSSAIWWSRPATLEPSGVPTAAAARTETVVRPSEGARFSRETRPGMDAVTLESGTLDIAVRKLAAGERFLVRTSDAEVEVRGTRFQVAAEGGRLIEVNVQEGRVEVMRAGGTLVLEPGGRWRSSAAAGVEPASAPLPASPARARAEVAGAPTSAPSTADAPSSVPLALSPRARAAPAPRATDHAAAGASPAPDSSAASEAFRDGVQRMEQGDYGDAADRLRRFSDAHPGDARAEDAAFLAIVSLQRAGRPAEAAEAARRYLAAYPNGYRRAEAAAIAGR